MAFEKKVREGMPKNAIKKIADNETTQLIYSINEDENIKDLARNPFLLSLIWLVQKSRYKLPRYRVELYRIISKTLFETWVMAKNMSRKSLVEARDYKEGEKILAPLALWMHENLLGGIGKEDKLKEKIIEIMKERGIGENEAINSTNKFFEYLAQETQLIITKGEDYYGFRHLSFEEFLSARALIMKESYNVYLEKYSKDPRWTEVFLLTAGWLGIVDGREEELTRIVKQLMENKNTDDLMLAGRIVAENLGVKKDVGKEVIEDVGKVWLYNGFVSLIEVITFSKEIMKIFKKTLLREYGKETYEKFIKILKDRKEDNNVRGRAASGLSLFANEDTHIKEILFEILKDKEENIFVRGRAARSLYLLVIEDENIKEIFLKILKDKKENIAVRVGAANGLSSLVRIDADIKEIFIEILKNKEENEYVRGNVTNDLSFLVKKDTSIEEILIRVLKDGKESEYVRGTAANNLYSLAREDESIKHMLLGILKDREENKNVRRMIVFGLLSFVWEDADIKEIFIEILKDENESKELKETIRKYI